MHTSASSLLAKPYSEDVCGGGDEAAVLVPARGSGEDPSLMGIVCCATSNSNSGGIGDEETEELIVLTVVVKEVAFVSK